MLIKKFVSVAVLLSCATSFGESYLYFVSPMWCADSEGNKYKINSYRAVNVDRKNRHIFRDSILINGRLVLNKQNYDKDRGSMTIVDGKITVKDFAGTLSDMHLEVVKSEFKERQRQDTLKGKIGNRAIECNAIVVATPSQNKDYYWVK